MLRASEEVWPQNCHIADSMSHYRTRKVLAPQRHSQILNATTKIAVIFRSSRRHEYNPCPLPLLNILLITRRL